MTEHNDENSNTLNIAPLRLFRGGAEIKSTGKVTPKRSMQQFHKLLLIKDQNSLVVGGNVEECEKCAIHQLPMNYFCRCCVSFRLCKDCSDSHEHPTERYDSLQDCKNTEVELLDQTVQELCNRTEMLGDQLILLQGTSDRVATSKRNLFSRMRKFVDELENAADLQINSLLTGKRSEIIAYEKTLRKLTSGQPDVLREQLLRTNPISYRREPDVQESQQKCEVLLDRLRAFCYSLRSPLVKEVNLNLNNLEETGRTVLHRPAQNSDRNNITINTSKPGTNNVPSTTRSNSVSTPSSNQSAATLEKFILKNMVDTQRRQQTSNPSNLLRTLKLIGTDNNANISLQSQRLRFGEGKANFFG